MTRPLALVLVVWCCLHASVVSASEWVAVFKATEGGISTPSVVIWSGEGSARIDWNGSRFLYIGASNRFIHKFHDERTVVFEGGLDLDHRVSGEEQQRLDRARALLTPQTRVHRPGDHQVVAGFSADLWRLESQRPLGERTVTELWVTREVGVPQEVYRLFGAIDELMFSIQPWMSTLAAEPGFFPVRIVASRQGQGPPRVDTLELETFEQRDLSPEHFTLPPETQLVPFSLDFYYKESSD